jgi:succinoglycan biosynthesis transport protein ExoP
MPDTSNTRSAQASNDQVSWSAMMSDTIDVQKFIAMFRRRIRLLIAVALVIFIAVLVVTIRETPLYSSTASLIIDTRQQNVVESQQVLSGLTADTSVIDSEVEVLRSRQLAERVAEKLNLVSDPEFNPDLGEPGLVSGVVSSIKGVFGAAAPDRARENLGGNEAIAGTVDAVMSRTAVRRVGLTFVMNVTFTSESPTKATRIANAFVQEYLAGQLAAKSDATTGANAYLQQQLTQTGAQVSAAEAEAAQYRAQNGLLSAEGATLTEQEISAYNQQLATVRAAQAEEEARLRTALSQMARGSNGDDVGEALTSEVVQALRARRAEVSGRVADLSSRYGPRYPELIRAQGELSDIDEQIQAEIGRIVSNLQARVEVARGRTASMQNSLGAARGTLAGNNAASVRLGELERNADSLRKQQESLLQRYQETASQEGIQRADARVVSTATVPTKPTSPKVLLNLLLGVVLGGAAGVAAVILAEMMDTGLATSDAVERKLGIPHVGSVPLMSSVADPQDRNLLPIDYVTKKPLSAFAEAFRSLRASVVYTNDGSPVKLVTLTSSLPDEGKTTSAIGLARVSAQAGAKVLLVDCDLRRRAVTRMLRLDPTKGLTEVLLGAATLEEAIVLDEVSGAYILPATTDGMSKDVFGTPAMDALLDRLRANFDLVVMDTPPVLAVADSRAIAAKSDAVVLLVRWRKTPLRAVSAALRLLQQSNAPVVGAALSRVDMKAQARHGYGDAAYYYGEYKKYYTA